MLYLYGAGAMPTTASAATVATSGSGIKTLLQIKSTNLIKVVEWGISFDGSAAATPMKCELIDTGTVFGTVTAAVDADVFKYEGSDQAVASVAGITYTTTGTGYNCTSEGTITTTKVFDQQLVAPTNQYVKQFPLGREPKLVIGNCLRIRVNSAAVYNAYAYIVFDI